MPKKHDEKDDKKDEKKDESQNDNLIYADDWFADKEGRNWAVQYVDMEGQQVRLRLVDPPEKTVTLAELRRNYKVTGLRRQILKDKESK